MILPPPRSTLFPYTTLFRSAGEIRFVALVIVVVTGTTHQEVSGVGFLVAGLLILGGHCPALICAGPLGSFYRHTVPDVLFDIVFLRGFRHITLDGCAIGQHLAAGPGSEVITEGEHVGIRTDAGIAEQVPGTAHGLTALQNGKALAGAFPFQMAGHADAGYPGTDDQDIVVLLVHAEVSPVCLSC